MDRSKTHPTVRWVWFALLLGSAGCTSSAEHGGLAGNGGGANGVAGAGPSTGGNSNTGGAATGSGATGGSATGGNAGTSSAAGGNGGSGVKVFPPGGPGCGFDSAAFCETFDAPSGAITRAGELDSARWSASRMCNIGGPSDNGEAVGIGSATVPTCRSGLPAKTLPSSDALICDSNAQISSPHLLVLVAAQNYGQNSYRIRQPFDFAGRTGKIAFDAEGHNIGNLGWISVEITELPTPAPSFTLQQNFENGAIPKNAVEIQFYDNCNGTGVGIGSLFEYSDYKQNQLLSLSATCAPATAGALNHFSIELSDHHINVYATPASTDGIHFGDPVLLGAADLDLPFTRGYVQLTTHNHATLKYSNGTVDAWAARWDNVGFDGPAITSGWREYDVPDSLAAAGSGRVSVGWRLADASAGPAQTLHISKVDLKGVTGAQLALENWSYHAAGSLPLPTNFALNYRLNGHAWKARTLTASELQMMSDLPNAGTRSLMLDVDPADLVAGDNSLELTTTNASMQYPPVALNVDLILKTQ